MADSTLLDFGSVTARDAARQPTTILTVPGSISAERVRRLRSEMKSFQSRGQLIAERALRSERRTARAQDISIALMIAVAFFNVAFLIGLFALAWHGSGH